MRMKVQYHNIQGASYQTVWDFQTLLNNDVKRHKRSLQHFNKSKGNFLNHLVFCEHKPVFTLGKSASVENLLSDESELQAHEIEVFKINRGGDITYHGPGQLTGYLIFDLELLYRDVHRFVRNIEECIIQLLKLYNLDGFRIPDYTGVWLGDEKNLRKICAIGVHLSRWVSMHGFALNVNTDLSMFDHIIPCGIADANKSVTSLKTELGKELDMKLVNEQLRAIIAEIFELEYINTI